MQRLVNKRILLGVTGGIAAYKSADLVRRLQDAGAEVRVVMTQGACEFITPLTMQALSGHPVHTDLLDPRAEAAMGHIELARWADLVLIAPASADFLARLAYGHGNDLLATLCLATGAPVAVAPAMNQQMWADQATQKNQLILQEKGIHIFGPGAGSQACGEVGPGRMQDPAEIIQQAAEVFDYELLTGKHLVITAGPTREPIDPVRYLTNKSSGKMGFALAQAAAEAGARVTLIAGPVALDTPNRVNRIDVVRAEDMHEASLKAVEEGCDIFIATAAVADYRPTVTADHKIKKSTEEIHLTLVKNPDIIAAVASHAKRPFTVGFAAETQDVIEYAQGKLKSKKLDMIATNDVSGTNVGFNSDNNALTVIWPGGHKVLPLASKAQIAKQLIELIAIRQS
ncbi:bifunctional phosphopantothenoylcysteine decarboxylase/phosphopantothenate--cysteine ligase CoaBC [Alcanivorax sp. DSM 26295]|jgi:phosphopantothenoylcysteine decarboxylase/phosphopantothenate--cysteine ligase|uniref:bifunctional phosphopantothenoylcysteine decarboxylase/phosphopantothenate--cysteine ligase CoaBC n=1 Tax=Alloalcanivorax sp. TaxID=3020835 RepID=UPI000EDE3E31|nr:bifunctional phosphopantothenoylcysteine decarboxylase/phosphopantothenate--cysteine ligase CoaBC [Pseudomonadota bacterium]MEE3009667.1 bifunctional phosphopantothenoylcysteine decarboxylase/phosphopantothenate--cysteine ligase CoaBC [Pseudomonadota bacterium]MTI50772.1 bifunctional phosphopantothenoylcysteine decarboxylase/phosphopantothenate--cysteine ligase CoaBC [Alcanivorax sp.]SMO43935.1 phosphopantothenoylcysteine decarboxylase / phosphopantothenate--cysteine ligase [Alcanivorax sp. D|tara:strand:+ start:50 stop:1246 length:1197 start_codon:yes stop_codon:yes gene_type:complete